MKQFRNIFIILAFLFLGLFSWGQDYEVKSIQFYPIGNPIGEPVLLLNDNNRLMLEFDVLAEDAVNLSYKIEHNTYDWKPSRLSPLEFIKGFASSSIRDYEYSFDTYEYYVHYALEYPNVSSQPLVSGNYKIIIYGDSPNEPLFERRFMIVEPKVVIDGNLGFVPSLSKRQSHHQLNFTVRYNSFSAVSPREEFKVNVFQNNRVDNAVLDIKATRYTNKELFYTNPFDLSFAAGNEFRWFNTKSTRYLGENIAEKVERDDGDHIYLVPDQIRSSQPYRNYHDYNGKFYIDHQEGSNADLDAEYLYVHFTLQRPTFLIGKEVYVYGALTNWELKDAFKLHWNEGQNLLEAVAYLKQGNYDYIYVVVDGDEVGSSLTEGDFYRTENLYEIFVYYSPFNARYDRLVGYQQLNSRLD